MIIDFIKNVLMYTIERPKTFGLYHLFCLIILITICVLMCTLSKKMSEKSYRKMLLVVGIVLIIMEVYKIFVYAIDIDEHNVISYSFPWYLFPFQFCSSPLYVFPLVAILPDSKVRRALISYMSTFMLFAGIAVMIYPESCFVETLGVDIQTMAIHGAMVIMGVFNVASGRINFNVKTLLSAIAVFSVFITIAMTMNITFYYYGPDRTFNMFYISPFYKCGLPILSIIYEKAPYSVFLLSYLLGFSLAAGLIMSISYGFVCLSMKIREKKSIKQNRRYIVNRK